MKLRQELKRKVLKFALPHSCMSEVMMPFRSTMDLYLTPEEDQWNLEVVIESFDRDCQSNINVLAARYEFYNRRQQKDETYD